MCNNYQNNIAISPNENLVHIVSQTLGKLNLNKNKDHNNNVVSDNHSKTSSVATTPSQYDINHSQFITRR